MIAVLRFIFSAYRAGVAYIDMDGCVLKKFCVPWYVPLHERLDWWKAHLQPTATIRRRLVLLYLLRVLGVRLVLWTNRGLEHLPITYRALGRHLALFNEMHFCGGKKRDTQPTGPVMDDELSYVSLGIGYSLLVKSL